MRLRGRETKQPRIRGRMTSSRKRGSRCHPLNSSQIFNRFRGSSGLGLRGENRRGREKSRFYEYHRDIEHQTNDCYQLRRLLNYLVKRGHLREYVEEASSNNSQPLPHTSSCPIINAILSSPTSAKIQGQPHSSIFRAKV